MVLKKVRFAQQAAANLRTVGARNATVEHRADAMEQALDARGWKPADFIAEQGQLIDEQWLPQNGARVVARAWTDPAFRERLFANGKHFATDFRDIPFHTMFEGMGGHGELVERREQLGPAIRRAIASGKTACVNVKAKGVISPIVLATTSKRDKASIE